MMVQNLMEFDLHVNYIGDDDDEPWKRREDLSEERFEEVKKERPKVRRFGEEREREMMWPSLSIVELM